VPTAPVAALSLIAGFAVAQATGVRPLGGIVLAAAVAWCFVRWREVSTARAVLLVAIYAAAFAASHVLADPLGTWGAVLTVASVMGIAAWLLADRPE
jgi:thiol:disulfide interchange protein